MKTKNLLLAVFFFIVAEGVFGQGPSWVWAKGAGGNSADVSNAITTDASGNVYVTGYFMSPTIRFENTLLYNGGFHDIFIAKYDNNGNVVWVKSASAGNNGAYATAIAADAGGNIYITGFFSGDTLSFGTINLINARDINSVFIAKYDSSGNILWAKRAGGDWVAYAQSVATDSFGNICITGYFQGDTLSFGNTILINNMNNVSEDIFIAKYDGYGNLLWAKSAGGAGSEEGLGVATDAIGNIYIAGFFHSDKIFFNGITLINTDTIFGNNNVYIAKYNSGGNIVWARSAGKNVIGLGIATSKSGNVYITGNFNGDSLSFDNITLINTNFFSNDIFTAGYDKNGNVLWAKSAKGLGNDWGQSISTDENDNVLITGYFGDSIITFDNTVLIGNPNRYSIYLAKYNPSGNLTFAKVINGDGNNYGTCIKSDNQMNVYITGYFEGLFLNLDSISLLNDTINNTSDIFIAKLSPTVGINNPSANNNPLLIYPNPTTGTIHISLDKNIKGEVSVFNVMGERIYSSNVGQAERSRSLSAAAHTSTSLSVTLPVSAGIYFVRVSDGERVYTGKVVVE